MTGVLMTLVYFGVVPFFTWIRLKDPLRRKSGPAWLAHKPACRELESYRRLF
jgi:hypothetical protein